ncbi:O-fucosyltransferase 39 [Vitis vinifera]|uniref:O-fucosyltransferase family protein n=1 Tax=Vitis vinifera TaxID=29760 RepID=A0A438KS00_VITVI|nr:O-fucosyltransferase 39 [Vitis vinifera]
MVSYGIAAIAPFSHRLAFNNLPMDVQRLRCKVNFQALVFVPHVRALGDALVSRLRYPKKNGAFGTEYLQEVTDVKGEQEAGKFAVLHLRFDKDMAAHSACDFGGGKAEKLALAKYRQTIWQGRVLNSQFTDEELRNQGRCPLTPEEIGLLLAALGFDNTTRLYLASHKVYGGAARISTLRELFPLMEDKKSLASSDERAQIKGKASLLAAVDYYVSMHSDIFISASPGNMHNALVGHRTYENLKTIRPNMALLGQLFLNKSIGWSEFQQAVVEGHENRQGQIRLRKSEQSLYTYPAPDCMCNA